MSTVAQIPDQKQSVGFKQVLIATDFSDASQGAFDYAVAIARRYSSALSVVHAIPRTRMNRSRYTRRPGNWTALDLKRNSR